MTFKRSPAEQPEVEAQAKKQSSPAEQDPKTGEPRTSVEDAEVKGQFFSVKHSPAEQPEVEAHRIKFH
jgi:hypothetical protein